MAPCVWVGWGGGWGGGGMVYRMGVFGLGQIISFSDTTTVLAPSCPCAGAGSTKTPRVPRGYPWAPRPKVKSVLALRKYPNSSLPQDNPKSDQHLIFVFLKSMTFDLFVIRDHDGVVSGPPGVFLLGPDDEVSGGSWG